MDRSEEGLELLGKKTEYKEDYAPEVLEAFSNKHPQRDYWVRFVCPEFTALCPITGQPDFATIYIDYIPDERMVETNSTSSVIVRMELFTKIVSISSWMISSS